MSFFGEFVIMLNVKLILSELTRKIYGTKHKRLLCITVFTEKMVKNLTVVLLGAFFLNYSQFTYGNQIGWSENSTVETILSPSFEQQAHESFNHYGSCQKPETLESGLELSTVTNHCGATRPAPVSLEPELFIFVSTSMPEQSLKQWVAQAEKAGGSLVLRGFIEDSPKKTVERVMDLFGLEGKGISIDPERFQRFGINKVPAVVILLPPSNPDLEANGSSQFEVVYGDVPLEAALSGLAKKGNQNIREAANRFLQHYRENLK